jgi:DNA-binding CsgD family transcriptional regulator
MERENGWITGVSMEEVLPLPLYRSFSTSLLEMSALARHAAPDVFLQEAMHMLRRLVSFDAAWWGENASGSAAESPRNLLHASIGLRASFAEEWNTHMAPMDTFAENSIARLGTVFRASGGYKGPLEEVASFIDRHGLQAIMAVTLELPQSGLLFFVSLYRNDPQAGFTDLESILFQEFVQHLVQLWRQRLADVHGKISASSLDTFALSNREGRLFYLGREVGKAVVKGEGQWQGTMLPRSLVDAFAKAPCHHQFADARLVLEPAGQLMAIALSHADAPKWILSPREMSASMLYAQGYSYKEIARLLCLTPATVRTYLRDAYSKLGVRNKVELMSALNAPGVPAVPMNE